MENICQPKGAIEYLEKKIKGISSTIIYSKKPICDKLICNEKIIENAENIKDIKENSIYNENKVDCCENLVYCNFYLTNIFSNRGNINEIQNIIMSKKCYEIIKESKIINGEKMWVNPKKIWKSLEYEFINSTFALCGDDKKAYYIARDDKGKMYIKEYEGEILNRDNSIVIGFTRIYDVAFYLNKDNIKYVRNLAKKNKWWEEFRKNLRMGNKWIGDLIEYIPIEKLNKYREKKEKRFKK